MDAGLASRSGPDRREFGAFALDRARGELRMAGQLVMLRPKTFALLAYLADRPGQVVPKQELLDVIWPGLVVTDDSLTQAVSELRVAIGDHERKWIRTLSRRGYLFDPAHAAQQQPATDPAGAGRPATDRWRRAGPALAAAAGLVALVVVASSHRSPSGEIGPELAQRRSIAVMPFTDLSEPKAPHVAYAVDERLSAELGRLDDIKVVARESSAALGTSETVDARRAGRELGVRHLLTGHVRLEGPRLDVSVRLLHTGSGALLWSDRFSYPSVADWASHGDILARVANELDTRMSKAMLDQVARTRPDRSAIEQWMRGRYILSTLATREQLDEARRHFQAALAAQPQSTQALTGLAFTHVVEVIQRWSQDPKESLVTAKALARQALDIEPDHQAALKALAGAQMFAGELADCMATTQRMLALNPNDAHANRDLAANLYFMGRWEDSLRQLAVAERLNPLDVSHMSRVNGMAAVALIALHRYDEALERARRHALIQPASTAPLMLAASAEAHRGNLAAARAMAAEVTRRDPGYFIGKGGARASTAPAYVQGISHVDAGLRLAGLPDASGRASATAR
jgi:DNA-binding winged helix-turn-helix (wHTH) protein/TolB-like protein